MVMWWRGYHSYTAYVDTLVIYCRYALAAFRFQRLCASVLTMVEGTPQAAYHIPYKWPHSLGSDLDVIDSHLKYLLLLDLVASDL